MKRTIIVYGSVNESGSYDYKDDVTIQRLNFGNAGGYSIKSPRIKIEVSRIDPANTNISTFSRNK